MNKLPLNALRAFAVVYEAGGIRPAARQLEITHSSVSKHVHELESWIGVPLLLKEEGVRALQFTAQGEMIGRAALESMTALAQSVEQVRENRRGNAVMISTTPSFAARWLLPRLHSFHEAFPWIELSVIAEQKPLDLAEQGVDLAIRMGQGPWEGYDCRPMMDEPLFPVMNTSYWLKSGRPTRLPELAKLPLLHDRDPRAGWAEWCRDMGLQDIDTRSGARFVSSDLVLRAAVQGLGVALARGRLVEDDLASGLLIRPFEGEEKILEDAYWIVLPQTERQNLAVTKVISWLQEQVSTQTGSFPSDR
ncbi:LysR substrate-binding domain-containing protein [Kiloniella laminariae]|uniref:LysR substrate-binding domain-containing protein n=1 Tax=Kiloniella laminariae TaxID=454162 RepID=UPI000378ADA9|nr:LysR substrate-binding domain-containing protein [Kiloniella laminariae]